VLGNMYDELEPIRICQKCRKMIPAKDSICGFCGEDDKFELTSEEVALPFDELLNRINNGFFRFEKFLSGKMDDYKSFGFAYHFNVLFAKGKLYENKTIATSIIMEHYFRLLQQHIYDVDKGRYSNKEANNNEDFVEDCEDMDYICGALLHKFSDFHTQSQINEANKKYSIEDISIGNNTTTPNLPVQKKFIKHLRFNDIETIDKLLELLYPYFEDTILKLEQALSGEILDQPLLFPHNQNRLVEVFRRLQYNNYLLSNSTQVANWLCKNFQFIYKKGGNQEARPMNFNSVYEILTKGKGEPTISLRIAQVDWLPHRSPEFLKKRKEKY
jgi:hypothetical protein